jgi:hypothetical protein
VTVAILFQRAHSAAQIGRPREDAADVVGVAAAEAEPARLRRGGEQGQHNDGGKQGQHQGGGK